MHRAIDFVVLLGQPGEMRIRGLQVGDLSGMFGELFVQLVLFASDSDGCGSQEYEIDYRNFAAR